MLQTSMEGNAQFVNIDRQAIQPQFFVASAATSTQQCQCRQEQGAVAGWIQ